MTQTVRSITVLAGKKIIMIEKPHILHRIFFSVQVFTPDTGQYKTKISFADPMFSSFYVIDVAAKYFEAKGEDIFQGDIWVFNASSSNLLYSATEILH